MSRLDIYNNDVSLWTRATKAKMKLKVVQETIRYSGHGADDLKATTKRYGGEASKINFSFPYYMVFVHKGAGRGYGGSVSGLFSKANGSKGVTKSTSMGKMGTGKRKAKPWFNPILEEQFPELANLVADYHGDKVLVQIEKILIK